MARLITAAGWAAFLLLALIATLRHGAAPLEAGPFRLDALALWLGAAVALVSACVQSFALRHMRGEAGYDVFFLRLAGLTGLVLALLATDWLVLFVAIWAGMAWLLADAIGHARHWPQARAAAALARRWLLGGTAVLAAGLAVLAGATGSLTISGVVAGAGAASPVAVAIGCALLALAAAVQCGLFPFQRWLLSSMTAPTPVSAFMHAGLVNAGGILVARFAPAFEAAPSILLLLFVAGAASALLGGLAAMVQSDVKRGLACSTSAQMGFMLLQCGLGFHAAAMAHLVLHGLYKASQFLGAGSALAAAKLPGEAPLPGREQALAALAAALAGGAGFALASGKLGDGAGALLVLFAALAAAQASLGLRPATPRLAYGIVPAALAVAGLAYGGLVAAAEALLAGTPGLVSPVSLNALHLLAGLLFAAAWIAVLAGRHRRSAALYARIQAWSRPHPATVTDRREALHA
jgi:NAD(P)H-quinone oxidoreductase subunit 5